MRPVDVWRRADDRKQWLQLGMLSASLVAPLIARWNALRGAERATEMLDEIETRLKSLSALAPGSYRELRQQVADVVRQTGGRFMSARGDGASRERLSRASWLWLAGAGLGLAAAGAGAYLLVRRRLQVAAEEPLLDLPLPSANGGSVNGGDVRRMTEAATRPLAEQPGEEALQQEAVGESAIVEPTPWDGGGATVTPTGAPAGVVDPSEAPFIGDVKTQIYHESNAENLPAEQNRVYFASEEEAREAGFRRDRDEVPRV